MNSHLRRLDPRPLIERLLHPVRRQRAVARLRAAPFPTSILFLCYGNICRSPYAAAAFARAHERRDFPPLRVLSAGLVGPNRPTPPAGIAAAAARGIDLSGHRSRLLEPTVAREAGWVVVMESAHRRAVEVALGPRMRTIVLLGDLDPSPVSRRRIEDPWEQPEEVFDRVYARVDRCVAVLAEALRGSVAASPAGRAKVVSSRE